MKNMKGFTLIELMIVIAILGILLAIAIPAYSDYTIRARISEGLNVAAAAKTAVSESRLSTGIMPADEDAAGISATIQSTYVNGLTVVDGLITIEYRNIDAAVNTNTIELAPTFLTSTVRWDCTGGSVGPRYRPANCRP
jgi:type IV pilus assembly protein PilA